MTNNTFCEQGAALVTSLILLLVLTVLGVSTMSTVTMEMRMSANYQFLENAFQLAETGLDTDLALLNVGNIAAPAATVAGNCSAPTAAVAVADLGGTFSNTLCYVGEGMAFNNSFGLVNNYYFQDNSQAIAQGQASSLQSLGMSVTGPAGL
jgi:Tfp pilus assembly protein PilX